MMTQTFIKYKLENNRRGQGPRKTFCFHVAIFRFHQDDGEKEQGQEKESRWNYLISVKPCRRRRRRHIVSCTDA